MPSNITRTANKLLRVILCFVMLLGCSTLAGCGYGNSGGLIHAFFTEGVYEDCTSNGSLKLGDSGEDEEEHNNTVIGLCTVLKMMGACDNFIIAAIANTERECGLEWREWEMASSFPGRITWSCQDPVEYDDVSFWREYCALQDSYYGEIGMGLAQWTISSSAGATNGYELLDFSESVGSCWQTDLQVQLAFYLRWINYETKGKYDISDNSISASQWAEIYAGKIERCADVNISKTQSFLSDAEERFNELCPSDIFECYSSIPFDDDQALYEFVGGTGGKKKGCSITNSGYDEFAKACVTLAYWESQPTYPGHERIMTSDSNEGSAYCTQQFIDAVNEFNSDGIYGDCGRTVSTEVLISGIDSDYPHLSTEVQRPYLESSDKWELVGKGTKSELYDQGLLAAGDVLVTAAGETGHTLVYVGTEAVQEQFPEATSDYMWVSGSLGTGAHGSRIEREYGDTRVYEAFRFVGEAG